MAFNFGNQDEGRSLIDDERIARNLQNQQWAGPNGGGYTMNRDTNRGNNDDDDCCSPDCCDPGGSAAAFACCFCCLLVVGLVVFAWSIASVNPTQYGLSENGWTSTVDMKKVYGAGLHLLGPNFFFIKFPAYRINVEFSHSATAGSPPVPARTGRDLNDPDSGGQPVTLSFSFQYALDQKDVGKVYKEFGEQYEARYLLFARMAVSDVAQRYTPHKFWDARKEVSDDMFATLQRTLMKFGHCTVTGFQLLQVDFPSKYESMITDIQLQVQQKLTSEYQQQVMNVIKNIDVMTSVTAAGIASINAGAAAEAALIINEAKTKGFYAQQKAKAQAYSELQSMLQLSNAEVLDYVKVRSMTGEGRNSQTVVGMSQPSLVGS